MFLGLVFQTITNNCKQFMFLCLVYHTIANNFSRNMSVMLHWQRNKKFGFSLKKVGARQVEDLTMCETHCAVHGGAVGGTV